MKDVDLVNEANLSVDAYRESYAKRYGAYPLLDGMAQIGASIFFKKMIRQYDIKKTLAMISFYLRSDGDNGWWLKKGHSVDIMEKDFAALHGMFCANQGMRAAALGASVDTTDHLIAFMTRCYECNQDFEIVCRGSEMGDKAHLTLCRNCEAKAA